MAAYERPGIDATLPERIDAVLAHLVPFPCPGCVDAAKLLIQYRQDAAAWERRRAASPRGRKKRGGARPTAAEQYATARHERGFAAEEPFRARMGELGVRLGAASIGRFALFDHQFAGVLVEGKERGGDFWDAAGGLGYPSLITGAKKWLLARANPRRPAFFAWYAPGLGRVAWVRWSRDVDAVTTIEEKRPDTEREWQREDTAHVPRELARLGWEELAAAVLAAAEELRAAGVR